VGAVDVLPQLLLTDEHLVAEVALVRKDA
jgi:hypothetical protein